MLKVIDGFVGMPQEKALQAFFTKLLKEVCIHALEFG